MTKRENIDFCYWLRTFKPVPSIKIAEHIRKERKDWMKKHQTILELKKYGTN